MSRGRGAPRAGCPKGEVPRGRVAPRVGCPKGEMPQGRGAPWAGCPKGGVWCPKGGPCNSRATAAQQSQQLGFATIPRRHSNANVAPGSNIHVSAEPRRTQIEPQPQWTALRFELVHGSERPFPPLTRFFVRSLPTTKTSANRFQLPASPMVSHTHKPNPS